MQFQRNQYRRGIYKSGSVFSIGPTTARYVIILFIGLFTLMYLIEAAQGSDKKIEINVIENQKIELNKELKTLELNASRLQSTTRLSESATKQGLVSVGDTLETITVTE
ncbi:hypothetical protein HY844_03010 [Candidatus Berkelbacteria bacterium]|nr:hypothetical protein [Candidatus Berkelbacteria bacterium]